MVVVMPHNKSVELEEAVVQAMKESSASLTNCSTSYQGVYVWEVRNFTTLNNLLEEKNITGLAIKSGLFKIGDQKFRLVLYPRGTCKSQPPIHLSLFLEKVDEENSSSNDSCFSSFRLSIMKREADNSARKGSKRKGSKRKGSASTQSTQRSNVTKGFHGRFSNANKSLGSPDFLDLQILFDPKSGFLVDNTITINANVVLLEEELLRGNDEVTNAGFSLDGLGKGEFFLWSIENFSSSSFLDILKADEIDSPWFQWGGLKICMVLVVRDGNIGAKLKFDASTMNDSIKNIEVPPKLGLVHQKSFERIVGKGYSFNPDLSGDPVWFMKLSNMLEPDEGYVIEGSAVFICQIQLHGPRDKVSTENAGSSEVISSENEDDIFESILKRADSSVSQPIKEAFFMDAAWIQSTMNEVCLYLESIEAKDFLSVVRNSFGSDLDRVADSSSSLINFTKVSQQLIIDLLLNLLVGCCEAEDVRKPEDYDIPEKAIAHPPSETSGIALLKMNPFQDVKINWSEQPQKLSRVIVNSLKALDVTVPQDYLKPKQWPASVERITDVLDRVSKQLKLLLVPLVPKLVEHSEHPVAASLLLRQVTKANPELELLSVVFSAIQQMGSSSSDVWECVFSHFPELMAALNDEPLATTIDFFFNAASLDSHHQHLSEVVRNVRVRLCGLGVDVSRSVLKLLSRIVDTRDDITKAWSRDIESSATGMMDNEYPHFSDVFIFIEMLSRPFLTSDAFKPFERAIAQEFIAVPSLDKVLERRCFLRFEQTGSSLVEADIGILLDLGERCSLSSDCKVHQLVRTILNMIREHIETLMEKLHVKEVTHEETRAELLVLDGEKANLLIRLSESEAATKRLEKVNDGLSEKLKKSADMYAEEIKKLKDENQSIRNEGHNLKLREGQFQKQKVELEQNIKQLRGEREANLNTSKGLEKVNGNLSEKLKKSEEIKKLKDEKQSIEDERDDLKVRVGQLEKKKVELEQKLQQLLGEKEANLNSSKVS